MNDTTKCLSLPKNVTWISRIPLRENEAQLRTNEEIWFDITAKDSDYFAVCICVIIGLSDYRMQENLVNAMIGK